MPRFGALKTFEMSFEEKLIEFVRANPCIYRKKDPNYKNVNKKEKIWKKLSEDMGIPDAKLKSRWKSLRNNYRVELRKMREAPSGSGATKEIKWQYFNLMSFLEDDICTMSTVTNYDPLVHCEELAVLSTEDQIMIDEVDSREFQIDSEMSSTLISPAGPSTHSIGEVPAALLMGENTASSASSSRKKSTTSSLEEQYQHFLIGANKVLDEKEMSPIAQFMQSMSAKIEKANLNDDQSTNCRRVSYILLIKN